MQSIQLLEVPVKTKKFQAYESIRSLILSNQIGGEVPITEIALCEKLGIGRTPIREALNLLSKDGLIEIVPNKGFFLKRISHDDLIKIYQIRERLDPLAAKYAASRIEKPRLEELETVYLAGTSIPPDWDVGRRFSCDLHSLIYRSCGNKFLIEIYENLRLRLDLGINHLWQLWARSGDRSLIERRTKEHAEIIQLLKNGDAAGAETASRDHISNTIQDLLRLVLV